MYSYMVIDIIDETCQEKNCPPEKFYPRTKFFSNCVENFCPTLKILSAWQNLVCLIFHQHYMYPTDPTVDQA